MKLKYVGCFEEAHAECFGSVKRGETIEVAEETAKMLLANPGQWEIVKDAEPERASRKGVN